MLHSYYFDTEDNGKRSFELPGAKPQYNPDRPGQVEHIFLDLVLDIPNQSFHGTCTITLQPVVPGITSLTLDAVNLKIESVLVDKVSQPFDYDDKKLQIQLLQPTTEAKMEIAIAYRVDRPQRGLYFITPDSDYPDKPTQVWTQGEDEDSRFWFPCFDYPGQLATSEIRVQVPQPYLAISNGELISREEKDETIIYHWRQKQIHPTYLMTLAVGDFAEIKDEWNNIPVTYYADKNREADARRSMGKTPRMLEFFSEKYGYNYPYPKYAQVCVADFIFGGMENTSTTLLTDRCLIDDRAEIDNQRTESLVAHELAHQWFGDLVVIKHWSHAWIKEGAASYSEVQWTENEYGKDDAAYYLLNEARSYISEDTSRYRRPIVTNIYREAIELYDRHLYEKGACVYHMIRATLGDELFDKAIHTFVRENAHKTVETIDLLRAIENATGRNLAPLFDQYVFRGGHPDYKVSYSWDNKSKLAKIRVTQKQAKKDSTSSESELFDLTIPVGFGYVNESANVDLKTMSLRIHEREQTFYFPLEKKPKFVSFDLGNNLLKTVTLDYPVANLKAQLKHDPDPISRIYAAADLSKKGGLEAVKALAEALQNDAFWGVRVEIAKELGKIKLDQAAKALISGLADEDTKVRRAVISSLSKFKTTESYEKIKQIAEAGDASYYTEAAAISCLGEMVAGNLKEKEAEVIEFFQQVLQTRTGWNEVVRCGAISGLSKMKTCPEAVDIILEYTQPGVPQALRLAAIRGLGTVSTGQNSAKLELILEQLEVIIAETFFLTQVAVVSGLEQMETEKAIAQLQALANQTSDGRVRRRAEEAVKKVQQKIGSDKALQKLREDLDQLKQENQELKSRLAKLEAQE
ncbi:MAG: M1 family metallopeptidase [Oscillatoria sp. PMC 1051.18]|nr:M1 family metallopeptidase [Oscillatoria sp. PMC 1050.18]MEC5031477.1 M1 family metallopeptidase [Oscillatoria sp. PMC 1051.18]